MNTQNGKCGVFAALTAALLVTAALITSCPAPEERIVYKDSYQFPEGMGGLEITVPKFTGERTILPSKGDWDSFDLVITEYKSGTAQTPLATKNVSALNIGLPIYLSPGVYVLTVTAKTIGGDAAWGESEEFTINAGIGTPVSVTVKPLPYSEDGNGTLEYLVTLIGVTNASAKITITDLVEGDTPPAPYDAPPSTVTDGVKQTVDLKPGSYSIFLQATVSPVGGQTQTASITEIVNIHQNLISEVEFEFNGTYFAAYINGITVTYNGGDDIKPELAQGIALTEVVEGETIPLSLDLTSTAPTPDAITITITNATEYDRIIWSGGGSSNTLGAGDDTFTITAGTAPFSVQTIYPVTVIGIIDGVGAYSTKFKVEITN